MSYFELAAEQLEFDLPIEPNTGTWADPRRLEILIEWLPKESASQVAHRINRETGCDIKRNAVISKAKREGIKGMPPQPSRSPSIANPRPKARRQRMALKIFSLTASEPFNDDAKPLNMQPMGYFDEWPNNRCRYGIGEPRSPDFYFCGADDGVDVIEGRSFCQFHHKICRVPPRTVLRASMAGPNG